MPPETAEERKAKLLAELEQVEQQEREAERARLDAEAAAEAEAKAAESGVTATALPVPTDPALLTDEQRQTLAALREVEQRGREQLDRKYPVAWNPAKNPDHPTEIPAAIITRIDPNVGPSPNFGTYSAVIEMRDGLGREWAIWCNKPPVGRDDGGSKLWHTLLRLKLQPLEVIAVRYNGSRASERDPKRTVQDVTLVRVSDETGPERVDYDELVELVPEVAPEAEGKLAPEPADDIPF